MNKTYDIDNTKIEVVFGEFTENKNNGQKYYNAVCKYNNNIVLITKNVTDAMDYDIIFDVLNNIYDVALDHLANILQNESGILVMVGRHKDEPSFYTVYHGCNETFDTMIDAYKWAHNNNDYADCRHMYTDVYNGHQTAIKF